MINIQKNILLSAHTTFKIGGPAKYFVEVKTIEELQNAIVFAKQKKTSWFILGNGSNLLIADRGYSGLVIKNKINHIKHRLDKNGRGLFSAGSGVQLNELINYALRKGYIGLHHFAYIPATVGGALYINAHYLQYFIGDYFQSGIVMDREGQIKRWQQSNFEFAYDSSKLKTDNIFLLEAVFCLERGDISSAKKEIESIVVRRKRYPSLSAGCVWQNISEDQKLAFGFDNRAIAHIIDKKLGLKGTIIGDAQISEKHAAFIENLGKAKATDVFQLIMVVNQAMKKKYGIKPQLEIELLGFTKEELAKII